MITVMPNVLGRATIWDKDVLIYALSQLVEAANQGRPISRKVHLKAYDLLVSTNRHAGGKNYERLKESLNRLAGTRIETNIAANGKRFSEGFGLIDNWKIERSPHSTPISVYHTPKYRSIAHRTVRSIRHRLSKDSRGFVDVFGAFAGRNYARAS